MEMEICQTRQCCHLRSGDFPSPPKRFVFLNFCITVNQNSSVIIPRLATGWTVRGSNLGGGETLCIRPDRPWGPPSLLNNGHQVFPVAGCGVDHPPPCRAEVKERVELYIYSLSAPSLPVTFSGKLTPPDRLPLKNACNWHTIWKYCIAAVARFVILAVVFFKNPV